MFYIYDWFIIFVSFCSRIEAGYGAVFLGFTLDMRVVYPLCVIRMWYSQKLKRLQCFFFHEFIALPISFGHVFMDKCAHTQTHVQVWPLFFFMFFSHLGGWRLYFGKCRSCLRSNQRVSVGNWTHCLLHQYDNGWVWSKSTLHSL